MKRVLILLFLLPLLLAGCAPQSMRSQALEPGVQNISSISQSLVFMPVRVTPGQANLKLRGMLFINTVTGEWNIFSFHNNPLLGSDNVPHYVQDGETVQYLLLDLPAGEYRLAKVNFSFLHEVDSTAIMNTELSRKIILRVPNRKHIYAGRLTIDIKSITVDGLLETNTYTFPLPKSVSISRIVDDMKGDLRYLIEDRMSADLEAAISEYPGLRNVDFASALLR